MTDTKADEINVTSNLEAQQYVNEALDKLMLVNEAMKTALSGKCDNVDNVLFGALFIVRDCLHPLYIVNDYLGA